MSALLDYREDQEMEARFFESEMYRYRKEGLKKLGSVIHASYLEEFTKILSSQWLDGCVEVESNIAIEKICEGLDLTSLHFFALLESTQDFMACYRSHRRKNDEERFQDVCD